MAGRAQAFRKILEGIIPERYRTEGVGTVELQERGKANVPDPNALSPEEKAALESRAEESAAPTPPTTAKPPPTALEEARRTVEDHQVDPIPGQPPEPPSPAGRDLEHRTDLRNINLDRLRTGEDIKALIDETAQQLPSERVETFAQTRRKAGEVDVLQQLANAKPDEAWTASQLLSARRLMVGEAQRLFRMATDLAERHEVNPGAVADEEWARFANAKATYSAIQKVVQGKVAEAGRALSSMRITAGGGRKSMLHEVDSLVRAEGGPRELARQARLIARHDPVDEPGKFGKLSDKLGAVRRGAYAVWINGLLSSPPTHAVNTLSNAFVNLYEFGLRGAAGAIGTARRAAGLEWGDAAPSDGVYLGEVGAELAGTWVGFFDGLIVAGARAAPGNAPVGRIGRTSKMDSRDYVLGETSTHPGIVAADYAVTWPSRFLDGEDQWMKVMAYRQQLNAMAYRDAARQGLRGPEMHARIKELVNEPTEEMHIESLRRAEIQTFTNRPMGGLFEGLSGAGSWITQRFPPARLILPFINTPSNIAHYVTANLPGVGLAHDAATHALGQGFEGSLVSDLKAGGAKADIAMARIAVSFGTLVGAYQLYEQGTITGDGPQNGRLREAYKGAGYQPNSVRVGDKWVGYDRMDPMGAVLGAYANFFDSMRHSKDPEAVTQAAMAAVVGLAQDLALDSTYLQGISDLFAVMNDPEAANTRAVSWIGRQGGSIQPYSALQGYLARSADVTEEGRARQRSTRVNPSSNNSAWLSILNNMANRSPFFREELPLRVDWKGEYVTYDYGGYLEEAMPWKAHEVAKDEIAAATWENRVAVVPPHPTIRWNAAYGDVRRATDGVNIKPVYVNLLDLDRGEGLVYEEYQKHIGRQRYNELRIALRSIDYDKLSPEEKGDDSAVAEQLRRAVNEGTRYGKEDFFTWYGNVWEDKGWVEPNSSEWFELAERAKPSAVFEANPDAAVREPPPTRPAAPRF